MIDETNDNPKHIALEERDGARYAKVSDLYLWKSNPRNVEKTDYKRLIKQLELGEHSPLLITADGEVLGGNTRLRAYRELGKKDAMVVVCEIAGEQGAVRVTINGKQSERVFDSIAQAKLELALSHNDSIGTYDDIGLAEMVEFTPIDMALYAIPTKIKTLESYFGPDGSDVSGPTVDTSESQEQPDEDGGSYYINIRFTSRDAYERAESRFNAAKADGESDADALLKLLARHEGRADE